MYMCSLCLACLVATKWIGLVWCGQLVQQCNALPMHRYKNNIMCHVLHVTCHMSLTLTATAKTLPLLTRPLCTAGWFAKTQTSTFFCKAILDQNLNQNQNSETTSHSLLVCKESFSVQPDDS